MFAVQSFSARWKMHGNVRVNACSSDVLFLYAKLFSPNKADATNTVSFECMFVHVYFRNNKSQWQVFWCVCDALYSKYQVIDGIQGKTWTFREKWGRTTYAAALWRIRVTTFRWQNMRWFRTSLNCWCDTWYGVFRLCCSRHSIPDADYEYNKKSVGKPNHDGQVV